MPPKKITKSDDSTQDKVLPKAKPRTKAEQNVLPETDIVEQKTKVTRVKKDKPIDTENTVSDSVTIKPKAKAKSKSKKSINIESDNESEIKNINSKDPENESKNIITEKDNSFNVVNTISHSSSSKNEIDILLDEKKTQWANLSLEIQAINIKRNELEQDQKNLITELTQLMKKLDKEPEDNPLSNRINTNIEPTNVKSININVDLNEDDDSDYSESSTPTIIIRDNKIIKQINVRQPNVSKIKKPIVESESESDSD